MECCKYIKPSSRARDNSTETDWAMGSKTLAILTRAHDNSNLNANRYKGDRQPSSHARATIQQARQATAQPVKSHPHTRAQQFNLNIRVESHRRG